jgi:mono/diheme cytochrome c family protein
MPSFQLSDEEIRQILTYIQSQEGQGQAMATQVVSCP